MEQPDYNVLFRCFVRMSADEPMWPPSFSKNRDRLLNGAAFEELFNLVVDQARNQTLLSDDQDADCGILHSLAGGMPYKG